ncbi:hypothetical protein [Mycoplasma sp. 3686d]|uniref:hypothetical protein n=1 Tax=Mycoplasma sp. 3686d TaxID=2967300 RepID=UPI00211CF031|nr:hypothetical protein [Mycoplasma sp. 3686d]UUM24532.1 hypothetical protein NPA12_02420 [Mycoplasma sp. 3686d]
MTILEEKQYQIAQKNYQNIDLLFKNILNNHEELTILKEKLDYYKSNKKYRTFNLIFNLLSIKPDIQNVREINILLGVDLDNSQYLKSFLKSQNNYKKVVDFQKELNEKLKIQGFSLDKSLFNLAQEIEQLLYVYGADTVKYIKVNDENKIIDKWNIFPFEPELHKILEHAIKTQIKNIDIKLNDDSFSPNKQGYYNLVLAKYIDNVDLNQFKNNYIGKQKQKYAKYFNDIINDVWNTGISYKTLKILALDSSLETIEQVHEFLSTKYEMFSTELNIVSDYIYFIENEDIITKDYCLYSIQEESEQKGIDESFIEYAYAACKELKDGEFYIYNENNKTFTQIPRVDFIDRVINFMYTGILGDLINEQEK